MITQINTVLPISGSSFASLSHCLLLTRKQRFPRELCYLLWSVKPVRMSSLDSKSSQGIVRLPIWGVGKGNLFPLKSPTFRFWHRGSSNIFHPSLCFSCCASKIETKPKGRTKPMLPLASGRDQGREESECVCVWVRGSWGRGFVKGCAGVQDARAKRAGVCKFCLWKFSVSVLLLPVPAKVKYRLLLAPCNF